jgi:hypothetical protein
MRDAFAKGRMKKRDANPVCKGEAHGMSVMTDAKVISVRAVFEAERLFNPRIVTILAAQNNVCEQTIRDILNGKTWKHVK